MFMFGIASCFVGIGLLCWLTINLAVYALPFYAGLATGLAVLHGGNGVLAAALAGFACAGFVHGLAQVLFQLTHPGLARLALVAVFAVPSGLAGYSAGLGLAHLSIPSELVSQALALLGASAVAITSVRRVSGDRLARYT